MVKAMKKAHASDGKGDGGVSVVMIRESVRNRSDGKRKRGSEGLKKKGGKVDIISYMARK